MGRQRILLVDDNQVLVALLARMLEAEGFVPVLALRGKVALEKLAEERPDAAVVDVLLPDMMGFEVGAALRKAGVPFVFMTGVFKGGRAATDARAQHGAAGYFEKPFDARKLVDGLRALLPAVPAEPPPPAPEEEHTIHLELGRPVEPEERVEAMELTGRVEVTEGPDIQSVIRGQPLQAAPVEVPAGAPPPEPTPAPAPLPRPAAGAGPQPTGELRDDLPDLLTAYWLAQQGGELQLERGKVRRVIWFERGRPVYAASNLVSDRFGPFLERVGKITRAQLDAAAALEGKGRLVGDVFLELGYLKEQEKIYYLAQQVKAIVYSTFAWESGRYRLVAGGAPPAGATRVDLHPANLIVRGVKKLYTPARLARLLGGGDRLLPSQQPAYALHEVVLEIWEAQLLPHVNGERTVDELVARSGRARDEVLGFLWALTALKILERV